jgi:hypothetical protein
MAGVKLLLRNVEFVQQESSPLHTMWFAQNSNGYN